MNPLIADNIIFAIQGLLIIFGFWLALRIARQRLHLIENNQGINKSTFIPMLVFISIISFIDLWLLMQPMIMRM
jgi:hypothetical protein